MLGDPRARRQDRYLMWRGRHPGERGRRTGELSRTSAAPSTETWVGVIGNPSFSKFGNSEASAVSPPSTVSKVVVIEKSVRMFSGELLEGFQVAAPEFESWATTERERYREMALEAMTKLLDQHLSMGSVEPGIRIAARLYPSQVTEPRSMFTELPFAVAVSKGREAEFLARLNVGLAAIRTDSTWQQINNRWMGN